MSLVAIIAVVGPIAAWLGGIYLGLVNAYGQTIGGILGLPFGWLSYLFYPFGL
jgi:hypothetical protein